MNVMKLPLVVPNDSPFVLEGLVVGGHDPSKGYSDMIAILLKIGKYSQKAVVTVLNGIFSSSWGLD